MTGLRIDPLSAADAAAAGRLLATSHRDYPAFRVEFPDPRVRDRVLIPFQTAAARDAAVHGSAVGAFLDDHLAGVALWQPPGRFPLTPLRKARMTPALLRAAIAAPRAFRQFARSGAALEQAFPDELVWYLQALGVHPDAQRRGVGAALLSAGLAVVDADHTACHLHTSDPLNVEYYRRWGFQLTQPAFPAGAGGPTYYGMTRPASERPW
ncbi:MAG TPA: GNAT family N-acetyltransferase [Propionibacteriaceae bacterium]